MPWQDYSTLTLLLLKSATVMGISLVLAWLCSRGLKKVVQHFDSTSSHWDDTLARAARPVLTIAVLLLGVSLMADFLLDYIQLEDTALVGQVRRIVLIVLIYSLLIRYLRLVRNSFYQANRRAVRMDKATLEFMIKLLQIALTMAIVLTLLQNLGVSISGLLAFGGVGGLAVGLAAKDMLANLFGGLTIYMDRPFVVGDKISLQDQKIEGFVEHIGWRQTRIRGYDRTPVYVPNALFTNLAVVNPSRMQNRRINVTIGLRYQDFARLNDIIHDIDAYLAQHKDIDQGRDALARFTDYGASSLDLLVRCFTVDTDWTNYMQVRQDILMGVGEIVTRHGAEFAFPTRTLDMPEGIVSSNS
ncbi:mechanosensitive ion channel family protein [Endozoicomonas lisbonensis]|uniref:MscS family membrane protein n=1 Tax=Endozoicomonas lisbonensis TaxID=3120522 RepID=A0ABV2SNC0_9GAMM